VQHADAASVTWRRAPGGLPSGSQPHGSGRTVRSFTNGWKQPVIRVGAPTDARGEDIQAGDRKPSAQLPLSLGGVRGALNESAALSIG